MGFPWLIVGIYARNTPSAIPLVHAIARHSGAGRNPEIG